MPSRQTNAILLQIRPSNLIRVNVRDRNEKIWRLKRKVVYNVWAPKNIVEITKQLKQEAKKKRKVIEITGE